MLIADRMDSTYDRFNDFFFLVVVDADVENSGNLVAIVFDNFRVSKPTRHSHLETLHLLRPSSHGIFYILSLCHIHMTQCMRGELLVVVEK